MRFRQRIGWIIGTVCAAASVAGAAWVLSPDGPVGSVPADTSRPVAGDRFVVAFGHVDVEQGIASLSPSQPGRVTAVLVREGQHVSAGAPLVQLDDTLATLRLHEAETDLAAAQKQLADAGQIPNRHQYKLRQQQAALAAMRHRHQAARFSADHKRHLANKELFSRLEADAAEELVKELADGVNAEQEKLRELECVNPTIAVERATLDVKAKEVRCDQAQQLVKECTVRAPSDGTVLRILVSPGDQLGMQSRQPAVSFCSDGPRIVRAEVEQDYADRVSVGQEAIIEDNSRTGATWRARVVRMSDWYTHRRSILLDPLQFNDVRTLECILEVEPGSAPLRIGQRVRVKLGSPSAASKP